MPSHMRYFKKQADLKTENGQNVNVYNLDIQDEEDILNSWAKHLREHYCLDSEIDFFRSGTGLSRKDYLNKVKFPDSTASLGSAVMSGDFAEILVHDYIEFFELYYTTRTRYRNKVNRNSSTMGSDVLGYKCSNVDSPSPKDELIVLEVKAQSSETNPKPMLQTAVNDSAKDEIRLAESLNAEVQRLVYGNRHAEAKVIQRFQNRTDRPYQIKFSAVAVHSTYSYDEDLIKQVDLDGHPDDNINLLVIHSERLMEFVKEMYVRASEC
ncbi:Hachiman antiphage defense system protein HamA [Enterococcus mundtii]|uniref:Hachiman antiphage defense system protein HamA n=1 Tax=Enterococcus TaxID=1350 RepID=UPI001158CB25|nr:Hachiman antiphage defense system protein HamA [Enterococcus mundtii]